MKHTILMISYNQEKYIASTFDSLFSQSELPYEVIISDDCSTDKTWDIIMQYYNKYPLIIKPLRNEHNLGVFGNINKILKMPTGDLVSWLSGDDLYKPGILKTFTETALREQLNPNVEKFILVSNTVDLYPDGNETIYDNYKYRKENPFKLKVRYGLNFRETGLSIALWKTLSPIPLDLGYHADWLYSLEQIVNCEKFVFIDKAFPVYRVGVGVVSKSKKEALAKSKIKVLEIIKKKYLDLLDSNDYLYLKKEVMLQKYIVSPSLTNFSQLLFLVLSNWNNYIISRNRINDLRTTFFWIGRFLRYIKIKK